MTSTKTAARAPSRAESHAASVITQKMTTLALVAGFSIALILVGCGSSTKSAQSSNTAAASTVPTATKTPAAANSSSPAPVTSGSVTTGSVTTGSVTTSPGAGVVTASSGTNLALANVQQLTVNGALCDPNHQYPNKPCTAVTICQHGSSTNCQTIDNILVDTGSVGLRIFSSLVTVQPSLIAANGSGTLAECVSFTGSSSEWGAVASVDLKLGGEPTITVPMQLINSTYSHPPAQCSAAQSTPDSSPAEAQINGILGVGLNKQDCGDSCAQTSNNGWYYACTAATCTAIAVPLAAQLANPVALLPKDNNGVLIQLPAAPAGGAPSLSGSLIFGIGTATNNGTGSATALTTDSSGLFSTTYSAYRNTAMDSIFDTGSPLLYIPSTAATPDCTAQISAGLLCPASTLNLTAVVAGVSGNPGKTTSFSVANGDALATSGNLVFGNLAQDVSGGASAGAFDWGLPFFFGRSVFVGIEGTQSNLGTGPYYAY